VHISQQLLRTDDFLSFDASPVVGAAAPIRDSRSSRVGINGQYVALTRYDSETNAVCFSDTPGTGARRDLPDTGVDWESHPARNCGSPIETEAGWLVLTHAVGPMRTYSISAVLLDLDDPTKMIAALKEPLLTASAEEQDGYVPNVGLHLWGVWRTVTSSSFLRRRRSPDQLRDRQHHCGVEGHETSEHPTIVAKVSTAVSEDLALEHEAPSPSHFGLGPALTLP